MFSLVEGTEVIVLTNLIQFYRLEISVMDTEAEGTVERGFCCYSHTVVK